MYYVVYISRKLLWDILLQVQISSTPYLLFGKRTKINNLSMPKIKHVIDTQTVSSPLIPHSRKSKFKTIRGWLISICEGKQPNTTISEFYISLSFEQPSIVYILCLYGVNTSLEERHQSYTHIDFEPSSMFFKCPMQKYKSFNYEQMKEELVAQLKDFTMTEIFTQSFLAKGNIRMINDGNLIWHKK